MGDYTNLSVKLDLDLRTAQTCRRGLPDRCQAGRCPCQLLDADRGPDQHRLLQDADPTPTGRCSKGLPTLPVTDAAEAAARTCGRAERLMPSSTCKNARQASSRSPRHCQAAQGRSRDAPVPDIADAARPGVTGCRQRRARADAGGCRSGAGTGGGDGRCPAAAGTGRARRRRARPAPRREVGATPTSGALLVWGMVQR